MRGRRFGFRKVRNNPDMWSDEEVIVVSVLLSFTVVGAVFGGMLLYDRCTRKQKKKPSKPPRVTPLHNKDMTEVYNQVAQKAQIVSTAANDYEQRHSLPALSPAPRLDEKATEPTSDMKEEAKSIMLETAAGQTSSENIIEMAKAELTTRIENELKTITAEAAEAEYQPGIHCSVCRVANAKAILKRCHHSTCKACALQLILNRLNDPLHAPEPKCPLCRNKFTIADIQTIDNSLPL